MTKTNAAAFLADMTIADLEAYLLAHDGQIKSLSKIWNGWLCRIEFPKAKDEAYCSEAGSMTASIAGAIEDAAKKGLVTI